MQLALYNGAMGLSLVLPKAMGAESLSYHAASAFAWLGYVPFLCYVLRYFISPPRHPFLPYVARRFPHMSEMNSPQPRLRLLDAGGLLERAHGDARRCGVGARARGVQRRRLQAHAREAAGGGGGAPAAGARAALTAATFPLSTLISSNG